MNDHESDFAEFIEVWLQNNLGVEQAQAQGLKMVVLVVFTLLVAAIFWWLAQVIIRKVIKRLVLRTSSQFDDHLHNKGVFRKLAHIIPVAIIAGLAPVILSDYPGWMPVVTKISSALVAWVIIRVTVAFISALNIYLSETPRYQDKPIASFTQLATILVWLIGIITVLSIILGRNPIYMFSALGAVSAVLLLVFKDTLLGFTASIQLTMNDMVRLGDWVALPKYGADGSVTEINLTTVKVKNWDNTISTVPTYSFVADSFKNWRGMEESGGRRIKRPINVKISSVRFCDEEMLAKYQKIGLVREYILSRKEEINEYNSTHQIDTESSIVNGRRMTNIGIFRRYILHYLQKNPNLNLDMTCMVRQLEPTQTGVPLEIYCFSKIKAWVEYEGIQSDIFDHILAAAGHFDIEIFENPAGSDMRSFLTN